MSRSGKEINPPADPVYNFLADETRDGKKKTPLTPNPKKEDSDRGPKKYPKQNQPLFSSSNKNRDRNSHQERNSSGKLARSKSQNEGNNWRQGNNIPNNNNSNNMNRDKRHSQHENQLQFNRQKSLNEKHFNNNNNNNQPKNGQNQFQQEQQQNAHPQQAETSPRNQDFVDRAGNISVSVSRDGEVKSVRLTSSRIIGSGRVAHSRQNMGQPQFVVNVNEDQGFNSQQNQGGFQPPQQRSHNQQEKKFNNRNKNHNQTQNQQKQAPLVSVRVPQEIADIIKKPSVQDRLLRNRVLDCNEQFAGAVNQTAQ